MQISAANLIVAAQQTQGTSAPRKPAASVQPHAPQEPKTAAFEPIAFKATGPNMASSASASPAKPPAAAKPPGSQVDIKV
jgi:hypothetical protein